MPSATEPARLALGTRSADKLREVRQILGARPSVQVLGLADLGVPPSPDEDAIEVHETFQQNAMAKALYFAANTGLPTLADDSGLAVHALGGAPGIHSKRFAAHNDLVGPDLDRANNLLLLQRLENVPPHERSAYFICAAAFALPGRPGFTALGTSAGLIAQQPRGTGGFGYDPLFLLPDIGVTLGEVSPQEKHRRSHRARAFRALIASLDHAAPWG